MKNIKYFIFILIMILLIKIPNVKAKGNVEIESIELIEKSETTIINSEPAINGLNTSFDLGFKNINDYAKYKITVNNSTDEDYEVSDKSLNSSEYIKYEYEFENNINVVKKNSKLVLFVTIKYNKELPVDRFENGEFKEDNSIIISLSNDQDNNGNTNTTTNPNTSDKYNMYIILLLLSSIAIIGLILTKKTHDKRYLSLLIISLALIPTSIYALKKVEITISSKTTIYETFKVSYQLSDPDGENTDYIVYVRKDIVDENSDNDCDSSNIYTVNLYGGESEQYVGCTNITITDPNKYLSGDNVDIELIDNLFFTKDDFDQRSGCATNTSCHQMYLHRQNNNMLFYSKDLNPKYSVEDTQAMNFTNSIYIDQEASMVMVPNSFTITNHDVIFTIEVMHPIIDDGRV